MIEGRDFAAACTLGGRTRQEDDWGTHVNPPARESDACLLAVVADGMGGMPAGDRASGIALRTFFDSYRAIDLPAVERLRHALAHANREVGIAVEADPSLNGMGCTLVAALFLADRCEWLSVGDSLILRIRNRELERVNPLHVYANELDELVRQGELSEEAARYDPERTALTSAIQGTVLEHVAQGTLALETGDVVMLASDGILTLPDDEIVSICAEQGELDAQRVVQTVVDCIDAQGRPGQDNATLIVVRHDPGTTGEATDATYPQAEEAQDAAARGVETEAPKAAGGPRPDSRALEDSGSGWRSYGESEARSSLRTSRLLWLGAAFALGAVFGAIGWRALVSA